VDGQVEISKLKPHPKNFEVYGQEEVTELADSISKHGLKNPIIVNKEFTIISGHRRYKAALELGWKEVPYIIREFNSPFDELETLVLDNAYRSQKTEAQKTREGMILEEVIAERAKARKLATQNNNTAKEIREREESAPTETGRTRDQVAEKVGISSGKVYEESKKVIQEIDRLRADGKTEDADLLSGVLEKAPSAANVLLKVGLDNISQEDKDALKEKKTSVNAIVKKTKKKKEPSPDEIERKKRQEEDAAERAEKKRKFNEKYGHLNESAQSYFRSLEANSPVFFYVMAKRNDENEMMKMKSRDLNIMRYLYFKPKRSKI
jgi:ParB family chromosome partitioning protein